MLVLDEPQPEPGSRLAVGGGDVLDARMRAVFAEALRESARPGARYGTAQAPGTDPRVLCPYYRRHRDEMRSWLAARLGGDAGVLLGAALDALCP